MCFTLYAQKSGASRDIEASKQYKHHYFFSIHFQKVISNPEYINIVSFTILVLQELPQRDTFSPLSINSLGLYLSSEKFFKFMVFRLPGNALPFRKFNRDIFTHAPRQNSFPGYLHPKEKGNYSSPRQDFFENLSPIQKEGWGQKLWRCF